MFYNLQGAAPATIGIINGKLKIGLTPQEIQYLASSENVVKTSKRDIPYVLSKVSQIREYSSLHIA